MADASKSRVSTTPEHRIHEKFKSDQPGSYEPKRGPFDFDMKSVWKRDADEKEDKEKNENTGTPEENGDSIKLPAGFSQPIAAEEFDGGNRDCFTMPAYQKSDPVNFSKLMSGGYGDDWRQQHDDWEEKHTQPNDSETPQSESTQTDNE